MKNVDKKVSPKILHLTILLCSIAAVCLCGCQRQRAQHAVMKEVSACDSLCPFVMDEQTTMTSVRYDEATRAVQYIYENHGYTPDEFHAKLAKQQDSICYRWREVLKEGNNQEGKDFFQAVSQAGMQFSYLYTLLPDGLHDSVIISNQELCSMVEDCL